MNSSLLVGLSICSVLICAVIAPPVDPKRKETHQEKQDENEELGLEYGRYLQQVVQILEEDKDFAKKLENVSEADIKSGHIAHQLEFVQHNVRTKLDELKRIELERLRSLIRQQVEHNELGVYRGQEGRLSFPSSPDDRQWRSVSRGFGDGFDREQVKVGAQHLDFLNRNTFEIEDLKKLIVTASKDLDELNRRRKDEFKQYELEKEHQYRESLKHMTEDERKAAETKHEDSEKRHKDHPKVHHPGSKQQLEQVWEDQDQLPKEEFNPSTFFALHDINGDGHLDEEEVEAILSLEIRKMYDGNNTDDDPVEMMEEYHRMREHVYNETDTNRDGLISKQEFMDMTRRSEFNQDDGWKGLDEQDVYSEDELVNYERMQEEHFRQLAAQGQFNPNMNPNIQFQGGNQYPPINAGPQYHPAGGPQYPPQGIPHEQQYQQHPNQGGVPQHPNQQYPNQGGVPQHPNQQYPNQGGVPQQHPNQQYPNQGGVPQQHPNQGGVPQHLNQQYPNQGGVPPQHPNQQYPQGGQHPNQGGVPPHINNQYPQQGGVPPHNNNQYPPPPQQGVPQHPPQGQQPPSNVPVPQQGVQPNQAAAADSHPPVPHQPQQVQSQPPK